MRFDTSRNDQHEDKPAGGGGTRGERFSSVWFQLKEKFQSGFMAMVKGGWGSSFCCPHAGAAALVTLGHTGGSVLTAVPEEQQSYVLLCRQDSGDSSFIH